MAGMLGAAALGLVAPIIGRTGGLISAPCAPSAAVLVALITTLLAGNAGTVPSTPQIFSMLGLTAMLAAGLQILYGLVGGGRLIKYIPYPVVSGYLSGVGVLIALGQVPKLFGFPGGTGLLDGLRDPNLWKWEGLLIGIVTIAAMTLAPRITPKVPAAIFALFCGIAAYFLLGLVVPKLLVLAGNPLVIGPLHASGSMFDGIVRQAETFSSISLSSLKQALVPALTLSVLLSIDTLKTCVGLDALTRSRHNSDRELIGQGIGNLASCLVGGMPGAGTMGPTLVNVTSGGRTPRSGVIEGLLVILTVLVLSPLVAWVPIAALAGILLVVAFRMFDRHIFRLLRSSAGRMDFAVIAAVVLVALTVDLIAASGAGIALAILLFIRDQVRGSVIYRKRYLNQVSSKSRRLPAERDVLNVQGGQGVICELRGNLFFGTTDQLFSQLEEDLRTRRFVLLDMRRVHSMDYTAAHLFDQMHEQLLERKGQLLFSGMPSGLLDQRDFQHYLVELGVVGDSAGVMVSETMDGALEWMEDRILEDAGVARARESRPLEVQDFHLFREFDAATLTYLAACMRKIDVPAGAKVFSQGETGDEIFLVRQGSVRILLPLEGGKYHHLATFSQGDFFGELAFLDRHARSANAEAKTPTLLYALSRADFDAQSHSDPAVGVRVFARLAQAISQRLRQADAELGVLEDR